MSRTDQQFSTPDKSHNPFEDLQPRGSRKRKQVDFSCSKVRAEIKKQHNSASPFFKRSKEAAMPACRSPQASKMASSLPTDTDQHQGVLRPPSLSLPQASAAPTNSGTTTAMVVALGCAQPAPAPAPALALIDPFFLLKMDQKMDILTSGMMAVLARV